MNTIHTQIERLLDIGRDREAEKLVHKAMSDSPDNPELHIYSARVCLHRDDPDGAREQLAQALRIEPEHQFARNVLFDVEFREENYPAAEELITSLIRDEPASGYYLALYSRLMLATLHVEKARRLADEALRREPDDETAKSADVLLNIVVGNRQRADEQLQGLIAHDPESIRIAYLLLTSLTQKREFASAQRLAQELLQLTPDDEELIEILVELRVQTHPLAIPLRPLQKYGWMGSAVMWLGAIIVMRLLRKVDSPYAGAAVVTYLSYCVYSWIYEPIMKKWIRFRGIR